jgi:hypothetical protein
MDVRLGSGPNDSPNGEMMRFVTVLVSALPAVFAGTGCDGVDEGDAGFHIARVAVDDSSTIRLTFSHPVAEFGSINPNQFRLSLAETVTASYVYHGVTKTFTYTTYLDLATIIDSYYTHRFTFKSIELGASPNQILLRTLEPLGSDGCTWLDETTELFELYASYPGVTARFDHAIFLHYAAGEVPITDMDGRALSDIGADWVLNASNYALRDDFGFTMLNPQLRIPCP